MLNLIENTLINSTTVLEVSIPNLPIVDGYLQLNVLCDEDELYVIKSDCIINEDAMYNICSTSDDTLLRSGVIGIKVEALNTDISILTVVSGGDFDPDLLRYKLENYFGGML